MIEAVLSSIDVIDVVYATAVDSGLFAAADFKTTPNNIEPIGFTQLDPITVQVNFGEDVSAEDQLEYVGSGANCESPQDIEIQS